jgi:hypothetical protein
VGRAAVSPAEQEDPVTFYFDPRERIVEGRTVTVRDRGRSRKLHVLILERTTRARKKRRHALVESDGLGIPGRGENSWDCEGDAIYGASFRASSVKEATKKFMNDVRSERRRRS